MFAVKHGIQRGVEYKMLGVSGSGEVGAELRPDIGPELDWLIGAEDDGDCPFMPADALVGVGARNSM